MSEYTKQWFYNAYKELTDDSLILENKKKYERKKYIEQKKSDTGL